MIDILTIDAKAPCCFAMPAKTLLKRGNGNVPATPGIGAKGEFNGYMDS